MTPFFADSARITAPERLVLRGGRLSRVPLKVRYGILSHPVRGLVLIDTGYGPRVTQGRDRSLLLRLYSGLLRPKLLEDGQPGDVLRRLGAAPADVGAIILTHFHADHVAALDLFPKADIFAKRTTHDLIRRRSLLANARHGVFPELLPADLGARIRDLDGLDSRPAPLGLGSGRDVLGDGSVLAVDLPGHAEGHIGLCFPLAPQPLLYAVDVQWCPEALAAGKAPGFPARLVANNPAALSKSTARVDAFRNQGGEVVLCHDPASTPYDLPEGSR